VYAAHAGSQPFFVEEDKKAKQQNAKNAICTCYKTGRPKAFVVGHGTAVTLKSTNQDIGGLRAVGL